MSYSLGSLGSLSAIVGCEGVNAHSAYNAHDTSQGLNAHDTRFGTFCCRRFKSCGRAYADRQRKHKPRELSADLFILTLCGLIFNGGAAPIPLPASAPGRFSLTRDLGSFVFFDENAHL